MRGENAKKPTIPSIDELALLTPAELSDLLANIVLLLRRFPDVPIGEITPQIGAKETYDAHSLVAKMRKERPGHAGEVPPWAT